MAKNNQDTSYKEIARVQTSKTKSFVISECSKGGFTLAQQMSTIDEDTGRPMLVFLKGAVHISNLETLEKMRNMFTVAIERYKEEQQETGWETREK